MVDQGPGHGTVPCIRPLGTEEDGRFGGFGLRLVNAFASRWGYESGQRRTTVWFEVDRLPGR
ncbi:ATP-binding protein [Nocardiopsis sp. CNT312]|uniref:ATP-binding protein n=1 Tax=Nocardiopsis sp. CNT312 TaxID=1137268 RepID=UPI00048A8297|nr:ATP-binding protein [Nocardiopsis sp. CNT312]